MWLRLIALGLTALILIPSGAHLFELPGKMLLDRDPYFIVQGIYAGWAWFAIPILAAIVANAALYFAERQQNPAALCALASAVLIAISLGVFFAFVLPGNQATLDWTQQPANWAALRSSWEYGHAATAMLVFAALVATMLATTRR